MKSIKNLAIVLTTIAAATMLIGCGGEEVITARPPKEAVFDSQPVVEWAVSENTSDGSWEQIEGTTQEITADAFTRGFPELTFQFEKDNISNLEYSVQGSRLVMKLTYKPEDYEYHWEIHAEKTDKLNGLTQQLACSELMRENRSGERKSSACSSCR